LPAAEPERRTAEPFPVAASRRAEPHIPWAGEAAPPPARQASAPTGGDGFFETDAPVAPGKAAFGAQTQALLDRLVALLRRPDAPSPFAVGLLAPAGAGKTSALNWLSEKLAGAGVTAIVPVKAADLSAEPERGLAAALYRALSLRHGPLAQEAAQEGAHFGADPATLARAAQERLDIVRRKLVAEKQSLAQIETRRAALKEILLYDTPGTRVDAYARKVRASFEPRLRRFGFSGDPLSVFKDLTRDLDESGGPLRRALSGLRGLYAYKGQKRLLVWSAIFFGLNKGIAWLAVNKPVWLGVIASAGSIGTQTSDFLQTRLDWLPMAAQGCALLALALLGLNIWRAFDFFQPLFRAANLLDADFDAKRHEIDHTVAHHARNVERLGVEADALTRKAEDAERRANAAGANRNPPAFLDLDEAAQKRAAALGFLESLSELLSRGAIPGAPGKIVVALDGFESAEAPVALFGRVHDLLAKPGFLPVYALDATLFAGASDLLARRVQLPLRLDAGGETVALAPLDAPLTGTEARLASALAPLAGDSPRAQKRLRNLLRFLRPGPEAGAGVTAALALFLAADIGGSAQDREALAGALKDDFGGFAPKGSPMLHEALAQAAAIDGPIGAEAARRGAALARCVAVGDFG
jgi:hypothetical protein